MAIMKNIARLAKLSSSKYKTLEATINEANIPIKIEQSLNPVSAQFISTAILSISQKNKNIKYKFSSIFAGCLILKHASASKIDLTKILNEA